MSRRVSEGSVSVRQAALPGLQTHGALQLQVGWLSRASVSPDWQPLVSAYFKGGAGQALLAFLDARLAAGACIYPPEPLRMLSLTPLASVRVVILGQDPYHGRGQAEGLAFSVPAGVRTPPSLRNMAQELARDFGHAVAPLHSLVGWANQGALLLNTCLTVEDARPASHARRGWEGLTASLLSACNAAPGPRVFMLWGAHAQALAAGIDAERHKVLVANHPSPLSARRGPNPFIGCGHFSEANRWLAAQNLQTVQWLAKE